MDRLIELLQSQPYILGDGAMGTMLQAAGLTTGGSPEEWNATHPEVVKGIYQHYADAGSQVITTNSFGGNRFRLALHGFEGRVRELNMAAARLAREVADASPHGMLIAGSMGPTGDILAPLGTREPSDAQAAYAEQAAALAEGGVDFLLIETMSALDEVQAAIQGIRSSTDLPVAVTMTFDTRFRTMMGVRPVQAAEALAGLGIRAFGANCGNGPDEIVRVMSEIAAARPSGMYLIAQSNAGLPKYQDKKIHYDGTPQVMAEYAIKMKEMGINYIGGCCGSTPEHIAAMGAALLLPQSLHLPI